MYSSTCFGCFHAHHQELNNFSSSFWFYRWSVEVAVFLFVVGPAVPTTTNSTATSTLQAGRPDHEQQHCYFHASTVKPEAVTAVVELLMMCVRTPDTC
jgi:hypothetical protein